MDTSQKVIIPKGSINPTETAVIEIPKNLQNVKTVVARPRPVAYYPSYSSYDSSSPATPKMAKKPSYPRRTWPKRKPQGYGSLHDAGVTWGGRPFDESAEESFEFKPWYPKSPGDRYGEISSTSNIEYGPGDYEVGVAGFNPRDLPLHSSTLQDIGYREPSLYRDFRPPLDSSHLEPGAPVTPDSLRHWHSSLGSVSPPLRKPGEYSSDSSPGSYYKSSVTKSTPEGTETETNEEISYDMPSEAEESSGGWVSSPDRSVPGMPSPIVPRRITQREIMNSLGEIEVAEISQIVADVNKFQECRRRLIFDASSLSSPNESLPSDAYGKQKIIGDFNYSDVFGW